MSAMKFKRNSMIEFFTKYTESFTNISSHHNHDSFARAADLFEAFGQTKVSSDVSCGTSQSKVSDISPHRVLQLAYSTLKYKEVIIRSLHDAGFFDLYPQLEPWRSKVYVILQDYVERHFCRRIPQSGEILEEELLDIERAILTSQTKLRASFARQRIEKNARNMKMLLPDHYLEMENLSSGMPLYAWINYCKTSWKDVLNYLASNDWQMIDEFDALRPKCFARDYQSDGDLLAFYPEDSDELHSSQLIKRNLIVPQDKSTYIAPRYLVQLMQTDESSVGDIIVTNVRNGRTVALIKSMMKMKLINGRVFGFGGKDRCDELNKSMEDMNVNDVEIFAGDFVSASLSDSKFQNVKLILVNPENSRLAVCDPIKFFYCEGGDVSKFLPQEDADKSFDAVKAEIREEERSQLYHALMFPKVKYVLYFVNSNQLDECAGLVADTLRAVNSLFRERFDRSLRQRKSILMEAPPENKFELCPPATVIIDYLENCDQHMEILPGPNVNGCFMSILQAKDHNKLPPIAILRQAVDRGILPRHYVKMDTDSPSLQTGKNSSPIFRIPSQANRRHKTISMKTQANRIRNLLRSKTLREKSLIEGMKEKNISPPIDEENGKAARKLVSQRLAVTVRKQGEFNPGSNEDFPAKPSGAQAPEYALSRLNIQKEKMEIVPNEMLMSMSGQNSRDSVHVQAMAPPDWMEGEEGTREVLDSRSVSLSHLQTTLVATVDLNQQLRDYIRSPELRFILPHKAKRDRDDDAPVNTALSNKDSPPLTKKTSSHHPLKFPKQNSSIAHAHIHSSQESLLGAITRDFEVSKINVQTFLGEMSSTKKLKQKIVNDIISDRISEKDTANPFQIPKEVLRKPRENMERFFRKKKKDINTTWQPTTSHSVSEESGIESVVNYIMQWTTGVSLPHADVTQTTKRATDWLILKSRPEET